MSNCTNVCGIKNRQLGEMHPESWMTIKRPSGKILKIRLSLLDKYVLLDPETEAQEEYQNLAGLKKRLREFP